MTQTQTKPVLPWVLGITGSLLVLREAVFYSAFAVLGSSINWPASLGLAAPDVFLLIRDHGDSMFLGYYLYLLSSALFIPVAFCLRALVANEDGVTRLAADVAVGFAVASAAFRVLGILRWLFAMPVLADAYLAEGSSEMMRGIAVLNYDVLNAYAGQTGEHLGVRLFATLFVGCFAFAFFRSSVVPRVFAVWAGIAAILFFPLEDIMGFDGGPILFINGFTFSFWAIFFGVYLLWKARRDSAVRSSLP